MGPTPRVAVGQTGITRNSAHLRNTPRRTRERSGLEAEGRALLPPPWATLESSSSAGITMLGAGISKCLPRKGH